MSATPRPAAPVSKVLAGTTAVGAGVLAYAGLYEVNAFRLRRVEVPVLPAGAPALRVLHISDLHMTPRAEARQRWVSGLAALEPDLVINTGDNIASCGCRGLRGAEPRPAAGRARCLRVGVQ